MANIKTITLIHAITAEQSAYGKAWYQDHKDWKADYNAKYYQQHKDQWKIYNQSNATPAGGRQRDKDVTGSASLDTSRNQFPVGNSALRGREKNVTGSASISKRGSGLGTGKVGSDTSAYRPGNFGKLGPGVTSEYFQNMIANSKKNQYPSYKQQTIKNPKRTASAVLKDLKESFNKSVSSLSATWKSGYKDIVSKVNKIKNFFSKPVTVTNDIHANIGGVPISIQTETQLKR